MAETPSEKLPSEKTWYTVKEAADLIELSTAQIYYACKTGKLPHTKTFGQIRIHKDTVQEQLDKMYAHLAKDEELNEDTPHLDGDVRFQRPQVPNHPGKSFLHSDLTEGDDK